MTEPKQRAPFKSGVLDHHAIYEQLKRRGTIPDDGAKNGVDITPQPETPAPTVDYYSY